MLAFVFTLAAITLTSLLAAFIPALAIQLPICLGAQVAALGVFTTGHLIDQKINPTQAIQTTNTATSTTVSTNPAPTSSEESS